MFDDAGPTHLDHDLRAVVERGGVRLTDQCSGQRDRVEGGEVRRHRLAEVGSQGREDALRRHGWDVVLQLCQLGLVVWGQQVGAGRKDLAEFDEHRAKLLQRQA